MRKKVLNEILTLQQRLRPLTQAQHRFASSLYSKVGYLNTRGEIWCQCCGHVHRIDKCTLAIDLDTSHCCQGCGTQINLEKRLGKAHNEKYYITYGTHLSGWQVFRTFLFARYNDKKGAATQYSFSEVYQNWIDTKGKEYILSKSYTRNVMTGERWDFDSPLATPRKHNPTYGGYISMPDMFTTSNYLYPRSSFTPILHRNGWNRAFLNRRVSPSEICKALLSSPQLETLAKIQPELFLWCMRGEVRDIPYHAVKICNRNSYIIDDPAMWLDYIRDLEFLNLDTHNAHYVCPADLRSAHCITQKKIRRIQEKQKQEQIKSEIAKQEKAYSKHIAPFLTLAFSGNGIFIFPLATVQEVYDEGQLMHHCVYANSYHKKKTSLLLSARDTDGNRIETIELSLRDFSILQSRAKFNQTSDKHHQIIALVENNINQIKTLYERNQIPRP